MEMNSEYRARMIADEYMSDEMEVGKTPILKRPNSKGRSSCLPPI